MYVMCVYFVRMYDITGCNVSLHNDQSWLTDIQLGVNLFSGMLRTFA